MALSLLHLKGMHGDPSEIEQEEELWRRGIVLGIPEDTWGDLLRRNASLKASPVAKGFNFSPMLSPRIGQRGASLSPSSFSSRNKPNSLKNLVRKLSFKNKNNNNVDIEKASDLAFSSSSPSEANGRSTWTLSNILTPRLKKTESLHVTPIAHSNHGSTHGRYVLDPVTSVVSNFNNGVILWFLCFYLVGVFLYCTSPWSH